MANRFPLIFNSGAGQIQELAASDNLDLTSSNLVNAGILFTSSGSATAPSLQIGSGATYNPGLYSPGTDQLAISTNGSGRLRVSSTGTVEIVGAGTIGSTQAVSFNGSAPVNSMVLTSGGLLGIGTSAPSANLHIAKNTNGNVASIRISGNDGAGDGGAGLLLADNESVKWSIFTRRYSSNNRLYISTAENDTISTKVTITEGGLVGIGTTSPTQQLHVRTDQAAYTWARIDNQSSSASAYSGLALGAFGNTWGLAIGSSAANSNALTFLVDATNANSEKMRLDTSGRLLVGTTTQVANVNGGILQLGSGITFPATAVAASDANTLDDYEEGTWTPTIAGDGTAFVGTTYFARAGLYRKIGSLVYVSYDIDVNQAGTLADNASIGNLPFPVPNNTNLSNGGGSIGYIAGIQQNYVYQSNYPQNNSSYLFIIGRTAASNQTGFFSSSNFFANNIRITGQAWYSV